MTASRERRLVFFKFDIRRIGIGNMRRSVRMLNASIEMLRIPPGSRAMQLRPLNTVGATVPPVRTGQRNNNANQGPTPERMTTTRRVLIARRIQMRTRETLRSRMRMEHLTSGIIGVLSALKMSWDTAYSPKSGSSWRWLTSHMWIPRCHM